MQAGANVAAVGRIGPNAVTRVAEAVARRLGAAAGARLFECAGLARHWHAPPTSLVDEREVNHLHRVLRAELGAEAAAEVAHEAGIATAQYLLANRIPRLLQAVLRRLPAGVAARVLLARIGQHAWTFVGSGRFSWHVAAPGQAWVVEIRDNPLCRGVRLPHPACAFYCAAFEQLFGALVDPRCRVQETCCEARGDDCCRLRLSATA